MRSADDIGPHVSNRRISGARKTVYMSEAAQSQSSALPAASPMEAVENDIRSLREETDRIIHSHDRTPRSLEIYDLKRQAIFNRLRSTLRTGDCPKDAVRSLLNGILEQDCVLLQKLQGSIARCADSFLRLRHATSSR